MEGAVYDIPDDIVAERSGKRRKTTTTTATSTGKKKVAPAKTEKKRPETSLSLRPAPPVSD
ncbi:hypothetical protein F441_15374 [Phytophthora nicotianae CJ01A1]|uniref:Uncharacterized protein n=3 Tax=Phytophthora nicotianae TaxID=4792 RepID=W2WDP2_PHYNI|nr:hypothetical protein L915_15105 [Phytophthora nicotianae]ETP08700.1 hypothetical protein F441_15374 [Phytophthora nicotianae CJ01A1]